MKRQYKSPSILVHKIKTNNILLEGSPVLSDTPANPSNGQLSKQGLFDYYNLFDTSDEIDVSYK